MMHCYLSQPRLQRRFEINQNPWQQNKKKDSSPQLDPQCDEEGFLKLEIKFRVGTWQGGRVLRGKLGAEFGKIGVDSVAKVEMEELGEVEGGEELL
ncbi:hypothetical protein Droror1_Dr00028015, partial [Drosera rotundifolia]